MGTACCSLLAVPAAPSPAVAGLNGSALMQQRWVYSQVSSTIEEEPAKGLRALVPSFTLRGRSRGGPFWTGIRWGPTHFRELGSSPCSKGRKVV